MLQVWNPKDYGINIPVKLWLDDLEESAKEQVINLASLPFAFHHVAIMPDAHMGYGMPIGGVLATQKCVVPNAVGVDIGCGMRFMSTNIRANDISNEQMLAIVNRIKETIPVGFKKHEVAQDILCLGDYPDLEIVKSNIFNASLSLGTLGGGNHFIEIQEDEFGFLGFMIHSGSRNLGKQICDHYNAKAKELNNKYFSSVSASYNLAFLPAETDEFFEYVSAMKFAMKFAKQNRAMMMDNVVNSYYDVVGSSKRFENATIDVHHNYASIENHFGENVWVHRKGATNAYLGEYGIIPGSQGSSSYIVKGKGNVDSFKSCSHGAGRAMSRTAARKTLNIGDEQKLLNDMGVIHSIKNIDSLDEAPSAYKDIDKVMENQKDLVDVVNKLKPLAVIKG
jgi:tRNA-splicing ligase RtcB (3'-phosphate/5'-hydroxy nucleic acid ligase)